MFLDLQLKIFTKTVTVFLLTGGFRISSFSCLAGRYNASGHERGGLTCVALCHFDKPGVP